MWSLFESLQNVLFLTDSVFVALCAYFDESMDCTGGYKQVKLQYSGSNAIIKHDPVCNST